MRAVRDGSWLLVDGANLCAASVLDRLNALLEPAGVLVVDESGTAEGRAGIVPHPDFRLFIAYDPRYGHVSRALRNRCLELFLPIDTLREVYSLGLGDAPAPSPVQPSDLQLALYTEALSAANNTETRLALCRSLERVLSKKGICSSSLDVSVIRKMLALLFRTYCSFLNSTSTKPTEELLAANYSDVQFTSIDRDALTQDLLANLELQAPLKESQSLETVVHCLSLDFLLAGDPARSHVLQRIEFLLAHLISASSAAFVSAQVGTHSTHPAQLTALSQLLLFLDLLTPGDLERVSCMLDDRLRSASSANSDSSALCSEVVRCYVADERVRASLMSSQRESSRRQLFYPVSANSAHLRAIAVAHFLHALLHRLRGAHSQAASLIAGTQWPPVADALAITLQWAENMASFLDRARIDALPKFIQASILHIAFIMQMRSFLDLIYSVQYLYILSECSLHYANEAEQNYQMTR